MKKLTVLNKSIITALCVALCVVLPMALHAIPKGGVLFSPMHLPVLLCGLVCGAPSGLICGILGPFISSMLTGMPAFGYMPIMMIELGLYGLISGLVMQLLRSGKLVIDLYAALIIAMLGGRVITGILRALIFAGGSYSWSAWAAGYFVSCLPGIILQLILLPTIYVALERAHLLPVRYAAVSATAEAEAAEIHTPSSRPAPRTHRKMAPLSYDRRAIFCLYIRMKYKISATAVMLQENIYSRYRDGIV